MAAQPSNTDYPKDPSMYAKILYLGAGDKFPSWIPSVAYLESYPVELELARYTNGPILPS